jgi:hypothetical protein
MTARSTVGEREECCKDVCDYCAQSAPVNRDWETSRWIHRVGLRVLREKYCRAEAIRERAWQEREDYEKEKQS